MIEGMAKRPKSGYKQKEKEERKERDIALFTGARRALARERPADLKQL